MGSCSIRSREALPKSYLALFFLFNSKLDHHLQNNHLLLSKSNN